VLYLFGVRQEYWDMGETLHGVVKWFNDAKGFGFIEHETGRDVFVHYSVIEQEGFKTLKDGEEVEYTLKEGEKGLHAATVRRKNIPQSVTKATSLQADPSMIEIESQPSSIAAPAAQISEQAAVVEEA